MFRTAAALAVLSLVALPGARAAGAARPGPRLSFSSPSVVDPTHAYGEPDVKIAPGVPQFFDGVAAVAEARDHPAAAARLILIKDGVDRLDDDRKWNALSAPPLHEHPILCREDEGRLAAKSKMCLDFQKVLVGRHSTVMLQFFVQSPSHDSHGTSG